MYLIDNFRDIYAGTEGQLHTLIRDLDRNCFEPEMTLFRHSGYIEQNGFPCPVHVLGVSRLLSLHTVRRMTRFASDLKRRNFKIVHIFFNDASIIAPFILKCFGLKVVISRRDMGYWYNWKNLAVLRFNRFFLDAAITNSNAVRDITHEKEHIPLDRIPVIYNGYQPVTANIESDDHNSKNGINNSHNKVIGIVANIRQIKRIDDLINAFSIVKRKHADAILRIIGDGDSSSLKKLAEKLSVSDSVVFYGAQRDVSRFIRDFNVAILCSDSEGLSNAIIEYMQYGRPVICTNTGGNSELVHDNKTGFLVPVGNVNELARKIEYVFDNPAKAAEIAENGRNYIEKLCDKDSMIQKHSEFYSSLI